MLKNDGQTNPISWAVVFSTRACGLERAEVSKQFNHSLICTMIETGEIANRKSSMFMIIITMIETMKVQKQPKSQGGGITLAPS